MRRFTAANVASRLAFASGVLPAALSLVLALPVAAREGQAQPTEYAKPFTGRLNTTGRPINMPVPVKDDGVLLGEIVVVINPDDSVLVPKAALVDALTKVLDQGSLAKLHAAPERNGQLSLSDLAAAGLNVKFDPGALELVFLTNADQRPVGDLSLARRRGPSVSAAAVRPALFSGYVNVVGGGDYVWGNETNDENLSPFLDIETVFRMWNIVVENDVAFEGSADTYTCPINARCLYDHLAGVKRRRTRLSYDIPEEEIRFQAGDVDVYGTGFQRAPDVLGVTIEKSPRKLRPGESIRPTGSSSFRIERPAEVEVMVNGAIIQRLRLRAGNYNLSDLPLGTGANEIQLIITDDTGERRTLAFTTFFDGNLLKQGKSEWSVSGGVPSYFEDNERQYRDDEYFGSGFIRYGLTDQVTGEAHVQGDNHVVMGGLGIFSATPWGFVGLSGVLSNSDNGFGYAIDFNYDLVNFHGPFAFYGDGRESFRFSAEYRSEDFRTPGEFLATAGGVLTPQYNYWLRLSSQYSTPLWDQVTATLAGRYQFADDDKQSLSSYTLKGDRYGVDVTLTSPLSELTTASVTLGYSNESYLFDDTSKNDQADLRIVGRIYVRPFENARLAASYDSLNKETYVSGYYGTGRGIDRWETSVDVQHSGNDERATAAGSVTHYGNRGELRVGHSTGFDGLTWDGFNAQPTDQRTSIRAGTALVFADGAFGIGQPVRGNGFAIIEPHASIADKTITVGTGEDVRARSDWLGPAVVSDVPAYTNSTIAVDVADLPVGYSLGAGGFDTYAPHKAGYRLKVGSAYSVSAYGTLLRANGEPVGLLTGTATLAADPTKQVAIFTNAAGKFGAEGLAPGHWTITMATEGAPTVFELTVPEGTDGLFRAGELRPARKG